MFPKILQMLQVEPADVSEATFKILPTDYPIPISICRMRFVRDRFIDR